MNRPEHEERLRLCVDAIESADTAAIGPADVRAVLAEVERLRAKHECLRTRLHDATTFIREQVDDRMREERRNHRIALTCLAAKVERLLDLLARSRYEDSVCTCHLHLGGCWPCEVRAALAEVARRDLRHTMREEAEHSTALDDGPDAVAVTRQQPPREEE